MMKNAPIITVFEKIGKPVFKPSVSIDDSDLSDELIRLFKIMNENNINLSWSCQYKDRVIYDFIIEELFPYEIEDVYIQGMTHMFNYEEFHPNHEYDLKIITEDFLRALLSKNWHEMDGTFINENLINSHGEEISRDVLFEQIKAFQNTYYNLKVNELEISKIIFNIETGSANAVIKLSYEVQKEKGVMKYYKGKAVFSFLYKYGFWNISHIEVPGFITK